MRTLALILILLPLSSAVAVQQRGFISAPFSFQGEQREAGVPASGNYDLSST